MTYTNEQTKRIEKALTETKEMYAKEMGYSEDLRVPERLDFLIGHMDKLEGMLVC